jgi:hypothetical protein
MLIDFERIKENVARLTAEGSKKQGTAFLIAPDTAVTCHHCLTFDGDKLRKTTLNFTKWEDGKRQVREFICNKEMIERDIAILKLDRPAPNEVQFIPLATHGFREDRWQTFAYPLQVGEDGLELEGTIDDTFYKRNGKPCLALGCGKAEDKVNGASGAPIISGDPDAVIVGILNSQLLQYSETTGKTEPSFKTLFAIPIFQVKESLESCSAHVHILDTGPFGPLITGLLRDIGAVAGDGVKKLLDRYLGTPENPVAFGGRERYFKELDDWLLAKDKPWALLVAPAARGKTALLVRWAEKLHQAEEAHVAFIPISLSSATAGRNEVASLLLAKLRHLSGVGGPLPVGMAYPDVIAVLLRRSRPVKAPPLVLILDGLDEALGWQYQDYRTILGIPSDLPPDIKILASIRQILPPVELAEKLKWPSPQRTLIEDLDVLDPKEVLQALGSLTLGGVPSEQLAIELHHLSEGDPLLLDLYLKEVADQILAGDEDLALGELKHRRPGWKEFLADWWADQEKFQKEISKDTMKPWEEMNRKVISLLNLLACAPTGLTDADLCEASLELTVKYRLEDLIELRETVLPAARRFIIDVPPVRTSKKDGDKSHILAHPKIGTHLQEFLKDRKGVEVEPYKEALRLYCLATLDKLKDGQVKADKVSLYVLRHLVDYLKERPGDLQPLSKLLSKEWREAKQRLDPSGKSFLEDVRTIRTLADEALMANLPPASPGQDIPPERAQALAIQAQCAILIASGITPNWPPLLSAAMYPKRWAAGAALAKLRDESPSHHAAVHAFSTISGKLGDKDLEEFLQSLVKPSLLGAAVLAELARRCDQEADRLELIERLRKYIQTLNWIDQLAAESLLSPFLSPEERQAGLKRIREETRHIGRLLRFAAALAVTLDEPERSQELRVLLDQPYEFSEVWGSAPVILGVALPYLTDVTAKQLLSAIVAIKSPDLQEKRLAEAAPILAEHGLGPEVTKTYELVKNIEIPYFKAKGLAGLARYFPDLDLLTEAERAVSSFDDPVACAATALQLSLDLPDSTRRGIVNEALALSKSVLGSPLRQPEWAWEIISEVLPEDEFQQLYNVLDLLVRIPSLERAAGEIISAIVGRAPRNLVPKILELCQDAERPYHVKILRALAPRLAQETIQSLWNPANAEPDSAIRSALAPRLAELGFGDEALTWTLERGDISYVADFAHVLPEHLAVRAWEWILNKLDQYQFKPKTTAEALLALSERIPDRRPKLLAHLAKISECPPPEFFRKLKELLIEVLIHFPPVEGPIRTNLARALLRLVDLVDDHYFDERGCLTAAMSLPGEERRVLIDEIANISLSRRIRFDVKEKAPSLSDRQTMLGELFFCSAMVTQSGEDRINCLRELEKFSLTLPIDSQEWPLNLSFDPTGVCEILADLLVPIWTRSLRAWAQKGRPAVLQALAKYGPVVEVLGGPSTSEIVARWILKLPRWWP